MSLDVKARELFGLLKKNVLLDDSSVHIYKIECYLEERAKLQEEIRELKEGMTKEEIEAGSRLFSSWFREYLSS